MTRAFYGDDWDCVRLLSYLTLPDHEPVILGEWKTSLAGRKAAPGGHEAVRSDD